jgi:hypothetical protein
MARLIRYRNAFSIGREFFSVAREFFSVGREFVGDGALLSDVGFPTLDVEHSIEVGRP